MFWISVSLLESDFEYEFLLAVHLLDKVRYQPWEYPPLLTNISPIARLYWLFSVKTGK